MDEKEQAYSAAVDEEQDLEQRRGNEFWRPSESEKEGSANAELIECTPEARPRRRATNKIEHAARSTDRELSNDECREELLCHRQWRAETKRWAQGEEREGIGDE